MSVFVSEAASGEGGQGLLVGGSSLSPADLPLVYPFFFVSLVSVAVPVVLVMNMDISQEGVDLHSPFPRQENHPPPHSCF